MTTKSWPDAAAPQGEDTRQLLVRMGENIFTAVGFSAARLEDIASAAGVRRSTLLYHFSSKMALYEQIESDIFAALEELIDVRLEGKSDPWERMEAITDSMFEFMVDRPTAARMLQRHSADSEFVRSKGRHSSINLVRLVEETMSAGRKAGTFGNTDPIDVINILGGSILHYVCNSEGYGAEYAYRAEGSARKNKFRALLWRTARAILISDRDID